LLRQVFKQFLQSNPITSLHEKFGILYVFIAIYPHFKMRFVKVGAVVNRSIC